MLCHPRESVQRYVSDAPHAFRHALLLDIQSDDLSLTQHLHAAD
jgi:hypothetical protein